MSLIVTTNQKPTVDTEEKKKHTHARERERKEHKDTTKTSSHKVIN